MNNAAAVTHDYPKKMTHPANRPAVVYRQPRFKPGEEGWGKPVDPGQTGQPERFPAVWVNNPDQEAYYAANGYVTETVSDHELYRKQQTGMAEAPEDAGVYPKILYRVDEDGKLVDRMVSNRAEHEALTEQWYEDPPAAQAAAEPKAKVKKKIKPKAGSPIKKTKGGQQEVGAKPEVEKITRKDRQPGTEALELKAERRKAARRARAKARRQKEKVEASAPKKAKKKVK